MATNTISADFQKLARHLALKFGRNHRMTIEYLAEQQYTNPTGFVARTSEKTGGSHYRRWQRELEAARKYWAD